MLNQLEKKYHRFAIPHLTWILIGGQVLFFMACTANPRIYDQMSLIPDRVWAGEFWRMLVFPFMPESLAPIWFAINMWFLHWIGTTLEAQWGDFRYNIYLLVGYVATVGAAVCFPNIPATNSYMLTSIFLAFGYLFPNMEILLFFILPVKIKYLAAFVWILFGYQMLAGPLWLKAAIAAGVLNFFLFFGREFAQRSKNRRGRRKRQIEQLKQSSLPFHTCSVCKRTDHSHPNLHFRYAPTETGTQCFCEEHLPV